VISKIKMKNVIYVLLILLSGAAYAQQKPPVKKAPPKKRLVVKYWQELSEKERTSVLADSSVPKNLLDLYNSKFTFFDNKANLELMKTLTGESGYLVALRIYLFDKLVSSGDTSILKLLQEYASKMMYNQPDILLRYFTVEHYKKNDVYMKYIPLFAADLDEKVEYANFRDFLDLYFMNTNAANRQMLTLLFKACEKAGAGSKNPVPVPLPPKGKDD
jgi:hypothetical protein